jgi:hypothetical protein
MGSSDNKLQDYMIDVTRVGGVTLGGVAREVLLWEVTFKQTFERKEWDMKDFSEKYVNYRGSRTCSSTSIVIYIFFRSTGSLFMCCWTLKTREEFSMLTKSEDGMDRV